MGCAQSKVEANPPPAVVPKPGKSQVEVKDEPTPVHIQERVLPEKCVCVFQSPVASAHCFATPLKFVDGN